ncbi:MAG: hypothetical protein E7547_09445 [Ruminococcaceae bacterium]|nr:hypothetical protein [Oscillospiraceae bacterium]
MKKVKKAVSVLFALIIIVSCATVSFAEAGIYEFNGKEYEYYGELSGGRNIVWEYNNRVDEKDEITDLYVYYSLNIPADGYYFLHYGTPHTDMRAEIEGETSFDERGEFSYFIERLFYLEKGDYKLLIDVYYSAADVFFYSDYLGEKITDISFNHDLLLDYDLDYYNLDGQYYVESSADATITFSSGKTYNYEDGILSGTMNTKPIEGANNMVIDFCDQRFSVTANVYSASYYIKDLEISNIEDYFLKNTEFYNNVEESFPYGENITVTFNDGTIQCFEYIDYSRITLPNGQEYPLKIDVYYNPYFDNSENSACSFDVKIGYITIKEIYFNGTKVSFAENLKRLKSETDYYISDFVYFFGEGVKAFENKEEFDSYFMSCFRCVFEIWINYFDFFYYYTMFRFI